MPQVLKEEVNSRIFNAAIDVFYQKGFRSATMKEMAARAQIPVGLIYVYYSSKEALFAAAVKDILEEYPRALEQSNQRESFSEETFEFAEKPFYESIFKRRKQFVLLMDKSGGTQFANAREQMISQLETHISLSVTEKLGGTVDEFFIHCIASNVVDDVVEIARRYESQEWAMDMLEKLKLFFFTGIKEIAHS